MRGHVAAAGPEPWPAAGPSWPGRPGAAKHVVGIIGCGRMGTALAGALAARRFTMALASRRQLTATRLAGQLTGATAGTVEWVAATSDIIALAAPVGAICTQIGPRIRPFVDGRVVIDMTNPGFGADPAAVPPGTATSAAERIASVLPAGGLVKALNCVAAGTLATQHRGWPAMTVPIAGDDPGAKELVSSLLGQLGFEIVDAGPLRSSRWIEGLTELLACLSTHENAGGEVGFHLVRLPRAHSPGTGTRPGLAAVKAIPLARPDHIS